MTRATQLTTGSVLTAVAMALLWFKAPVIPAVMGALAGGLVLFWSNRRQGECLARRGFEI